MQNNIIREDLDAVIDYLQQGDPVLTQSKNVQAFEEEWSEWLGVKYSVFVNSGSSANQLTLAALRLHYPEGGEVIVAPLGWVSDIAGIIQAGFTPVFADINPQHLGMDTFQIISALNENTRAVLLTHVQGFNALTDKLLDELQSRNIILIEDVCESHGATHRGRKLGSFGWASNFSFYYAHHMSTIEGGMICTNDKKVFQLARMLRSHGMSREIGDKKIEREIINKNSKLSPKFIFLHPAYNFRNNEIGAVIGLNQLKSLDKNNNIRKKNLMTFLSNLDQIKYRTDFDTKGSCNYAFPLVLKKASFKNRNKLEKILIKKKIEFRRGNSGGGNQLRQPYLKKVLKKINFKKFKEVDHIHFFGYYIGNYPTLDTKKIKKICSILNSINYDN